MNGIRHEECSVDKLVGWFWPPFPQKRVELTSALQPYSLYVNNMDLLFLWLSLNRSNNNNIFNMLVYWFILLAYLLTQPAFWWVKDCIIYAESGYQSNFAEKRQRNISQRLWTHRTTTTETQSGRLDPNRNITRTRLYHELCLCNHARFGTWNSTLLATRDTERQRERVQCQSDLRS